MKKTIHSYSVMITLLLLLFLTGCSTGNSSAQANQNKLFPDDSGLYPIIRDSLFGYINTKGEVVIKPQFEKAAQFSEGLAYFEKDGKYGFINPKGKVVIQPVYEKRARGWFNLSIEPMGESFFKEGLAVVNKNGLFGYINQKGEEVIPAGFTVAYPFCQGFASVRIGQAIYYINKKGEKQFGRDFEWALGFNDGLALVQIDGKTGYINTAGKLVIPAKYYTGGMFVDGCTVVKDTWESKTWKLIDKKGTVLFEKPYKMNRGSGKYVYFSENLNEGLLDLKGNIVVHAKYDMIIGFMDNVAIVKVDSEENLFGLINKNGEWIVEPKYEGMFPAGDNMILVGTKDRELGYIDFSGKVIWKPGK